MAVEAANRTELTLPVSPHFFLPIQNKQNFNIAVEVCVCVVEVSVCVVEVPVCV